MIETGWAGQVMPVEVFRGVLAAAGATGSNFRDHRDAGVSLGLWRVGQIGKAKGFVRVLAPSPD